MAESLNIDSAAEKENGGPESACAIPGDASECSPEAPCVISGGFAEWKQVFGIKDRDLRDYPALTLAYIGDSVYELAVRTVLVRKSRSAVDRIHRSASHYSRASAQSAIVGILEPFFTEEETEIYKRGRNAHALTRAKNASVADYRRATGLEALIGYLYLKEDFERMMWLIHTGISTFHEESKHE